MYKVIIFFFFFFLQFLSCNSLGWGWIVMAHNRYAFLSTAAVTLVTFLLLPSWLVANTKKISSSSQSQRKRGSKIDVSYIIYLITFAICQNNRAQSPNVFCEALWNLLDFKHALYLWLLSSMCFAESHGSSNVCISGSANVFTRKPYIQLHFFKWHWRESK